MSVYQIGDRRKRDSPGIANLRQKVKLFPELIFASYLQEKNPDYFWTTVSAVTSCEASPTIDD
jgi:hypothetical protein